MNKASGSPVKAGRIVTEGGYAPYTKTLKLVADGTTVERDTGYDLPARAIVRDVFVYVTAAASAASVVDVGLLSSSSGGDADGFLDGISSTGTGLKLGAFTASTSVGATANTFGVLLSHFNAGSTVNVNQLATNKSFASDAVTAKSISWTINSTDTTFRGDLVLNLIEIGSF